MGWNVCVGGRIFPKPNEAVTYTLCTKIKDNNVTDIQDGLKEILAIIKPTNGRLHFSVVGGVLGLGGGCMNHQCVLINSQDLDNEKEIFQISSQEYLQCECKATSPLADPYNTD